MIKKWKTLASKPVFNRPRWELTEDTVELPNGKHITYIRERAGATHSVAVIAIDDKNRMLLQREYSYPPNAVLWQLPGGGMNPGEEVTETGLRELSEESGLTAKKCTLLGSFYTSNRRSDQLQYVVVCSDLISRTLPADPEEFIESVWMEQSAVTELVKSGAIQNINLLAALQLFTNSPFAIK